MTVQCIKGCPTHGLVKNKVYPVVERGLFEKQITLRLQLQDRVKTFYVPMVHKNKVDAGLPFNVHGGSDPTHKAKLILATEDFYG